MERAMIEARVQLEMEGVLPPEGMWTPTGIHVSKETYTCVKRDLHMCQKRPTHVDADRYPPAHITRDMHVSSSSYHT